MSGGKSVCGKCLRKQVSLLVLVEREPLWRILPLFKLSLENLTELIDPEDEYWKALQKTFAHPDPKSLADLHYSFSPSGLLLNSSSGLSSFSLLFHEPMISFSFSFFLFSLLLLSSPPWTHDLLLSSLSLLSSLFHEPMI